MFDEGNAQLSAVGFYNPMMGGGDSVSASGGGGGGFSGVFDIENGKIVRCALVFGRQWLQCDDTALDVLGEGKSPNGVIYAEISHGSAGSLGLAVKHKEDGVLPDNSLAKSYRALYYSVGSGASKMWADVRYQPALFAMN